MYAQTKKPFRIVWSFLTLLLVVVSACKPNPIKEYIRGTWYYNDLHLAGIASEQHLEAFWTFAGDEYESESCCFNGETYERGNYRTVSCDGDTCTLEFYNRTGHIAGTSIEKNSTYEATIVLDETNDTLQIGRAVYTRWQGP